MKTSFLILSLLLVSAGAASSQNRLSVTVIDSVNGEPVAGVNVSIVGTRLGAATDTDGKAVVSGIPDGRDSVRFSSIGYDTRNIVLLFPLSADEENLVVRLRESSVELHNVTVTTTRTGYHLSDAPIRVEVKGEDDIQETMIDHPSSISELFLESTGMQVLQTSAVSNYVSVKMQGLDGSYTQILKDGFPLYGGLSSGLSLTQIPPLDLKRVEIIKGPSSSLYGGGAIAGLINLITKTPDPEGKTTILLNGESDRGLDGGIFYSRQYDKRLGVTLMFNGNSHSAYDADGSGFSDIPKKTSYTVNPKIFYDFGGNSKLIFGLSSGYENLEGGDMTALSSGTTPQHDYLEKSRSGRTDTQLELDTRLGETDVTFKNSVGYFSLENSVDTLSFSGAQWMSYTELTLQSHTGEHTITGGLTLTSDRFIDGGATAGLDRSYSLWTAGVFGQDDWRVAGPLTVETGLRIDKPKGYSSEVLPRIGAIYRLNDELGLRASAGMGYEVPTIFSDQSDPYDIYRILPTGGGVSPEKSVGGEFDITYDAILEGKLSLSLDQAFFYTRVSDPFVVVPRTVSGRSYLSLTNADGYLFSRGAETDLKLTYGNAQAFIGYTYADAADSYSGSQGEVYLTPKNRFVTDVAYEIENFGEAGIELRYTGTQRLHDGTYSPSYWIMDLLFEKTFHAVTFFVAAEDLFNYKQGNHSPVFSGPVTDPRFSDIWAPLEGRIINGGIKIRM